ncbi:MAG: arginine--tRNA ligase [Bacteroidetes bacterium]|nr:arginine--tRNA ligase [Bacteroidota bacterium]MBL6943648.1 arginine--tRNA ligase [Bacteroidales bacterium]
MMIEQILINTIHKAIKELYGQEIPCNIAQVQKTREEFEGDYTIVVFPLLKTSKKGVEQTAEELGKYMVANLIEVTGYNIIKGFLNLSISNVYWLDFFNENVGKSNFGSHNQKDTDPVVVEFSSPNTNKPLHLGHIRNNLIGWSVAEILNNNGQKVARVNLVNDRGIHICKSMVAWQKWGNNNNPENSNIKGDRLVGDYYVLFDKKNKEEITSLMADGFTKDEASNSTSLMLESKQMLKDWEDGIEEVRELWKKMNNWVYKGMDATYARMGISFDKVYYESETYLLGKKLVEEGLRSGVFFQKDDGSVWCDLSEDGLDEKLLIRADGTSVYMTQDIGTAQLRYDDYHPSELIYVVGNEQNYHFDVLKLILKKLGKSWADHIRHLNYGMVELPFGKMKSREGTVVDADDLIDEMYLTAKKTSEELGKFDDFSNDEATELFNMLSMGALKYFILKVDPKKTMVFNPVESIDFNGNTGPFIQYTHARIRSIIRKSNQLKINYNLKFNIDYKFERKEISLLKLLHNYPEITKQAAYSHSPALIANYAYELAKEYNQYYHEVVILKEVDENKRNFRILLSEFTGNNIKSSMALLGIQVPERM